MKNKSIANALGVSERWVRELISKGIFKKDKNDELKLTDCIKAYTQYRIDLELKNVRNSSGEMLELKEEECRLKKAQADEKEFDLEVKQGKYIEIAILEQELSKYVSNCKAKLLSIPNKAAVQVVDMDKTIDIEEFLKELICESLQELAENPYQSILENELEDYETSIEEN